MYKSLFCQLPICNLFTQHVIYLLWRDTSSELWTPVLSFTLINHPLQLCLISAITVLFTLLQTNISFHTIHLILCFQQNRWDWQPHCKLGQSILVVLCAGSTLLLTPVVRPANSQPATPSEATLFSYWSIKPWFLTEGKLAAVLIIPSSWGSPTVRPLHQLNTRHISLLIFIVLDPHELPIMIVDIFVILFVVDLFSMSWYLRFESSFVYDVWVDAYVDPILKYLFWSNLYG